MPTLKPLLFNTLHSDGIHGGGRNSSPQINLTSSVLTIIDYAFTEEKLDLIHGRFMFVEVAPSPLDLNSHMDIVSMRFDNALSAASSVPMRPTQRDTAVEKEIFQPQENNRILYELS